MVRWCGTVVRYRGAVRWCGCLRYGTVVRWYGTVVPYGGTMERYVVGYEVRYDGAVALRYGTMVRYVGTVVLVLFEVHYMVPW